MTETIQGLTAEQHDELADQAAARNDRRRSEQLDDAYVSEFADGLSQRLHRTNARLAREGGTTEALGLFDVSSGERVRAKLIDGKYGLCWAFCDEQDRFTGRFLPFNGGRGTSRRQKAEGFVERNETVPAEAKVIGSGTGFSGLASCYVQTVRTDGGYPADAVVR